MSLTQWLGLLLVVYGLGVLAQAVRSWLELRALARRDQRLRRMARRLPPDPEQARRAIARLVTEQERIEARLDRVTLRRCFTWGLWS